MLISFQDNKLMDFSVRLIDFQITYLSNYMTACSDRSEIKQKCLHITTLYSSCTIYISANVK